MLSTEDVLQITRRVHQLVYGLYITLFMSESTLHAYSQLYRTYNVGMGPGVRDRGQGNF